MPDRDLSRPVVTLLAIIAVISLGNAPGHAQITLDGTLGPEGTLAGPDFVIAADLGLQNDGNLFHSFGQFNVHTGENAAFTGPASVENILGRITGGEVSTIDGLLRSTIPDVNLYLDESGGDFVWCRGAAGCARLLSCDHRMTRAEGSGAGGDLRLETGTLMLQDLARIVTTTVGLGQGGDIDIAADEVSLSNSGTTEDTLTGFHSTTEGQAAGSDAGGAIQIRAGTLAAGDGARISTETHRRSRRCWPGSS